MVLLVPIRQQGRTRRHERGAECGGRVDAEKTCGIDADGEIVWSWRAHAGAKLATMLTRCAGDGGKRWFTEESAYKP